jgi:hypothetical protein
VHSRFKAQILLLSFPNASFLPWTSKKNPNSQYPTDFVEPWCFSHWPGANCFITHFCASKRQKLKMLDYYNTVNSPFLPSTPPASHSVAAVSVTPVYIDEHNNTDLCSNN